MPKADKHFTSSMHFWVILSLILFKLFLLLQFSTLFCTSWFQSRFLNIFTAHNPTLYQFCLKWVYQAMLKVNHTVNPIFLFILRYSQCGLQEEPQIKSSPAQAPAFHCYCLILTDIISSYKTQNINVEAPYSEHDMSP